MDPLGADLMDASFTDGMTPPSSSRREKDKSRMVLYFLDLCGIIEIGEIFSCGGGLSQISFQSTIRACPAATFARTSSVSWSMASGARAD